MNYAAEQDLMRVIACASKQRDWEAIDRVMEEQRLRGNMSVMRGFRDAQGGEVRPQLETPDPLTIHDLPLKDGKRIGPNGNPVTVDAYSGKWKEPGSKAA